MIHELLGGASAAGLLGGERKISISGTPLLHHTATPSPSLSPSPSPSPSPSSSATTAPNTSTTASSTSDQNLRCPRCDSSNTKFCYYNNYNLTQPRHFCKTCRRYWTKGGALRNVPIGGGCRKNKSSSVSASLAKSSSTSNNKFKSIASEIGRSGFGNGFDHYDHHPLSSPILRATPQNSHLLALLRSAIQNPNPNPSVKEEGGMVGTHILTTQPAVEGRTLGLDHLGQVPSLGLFWKSNTQQEQSGQQNGFSSGVAQAQSSGMQELYQRLRSSSSTGNYYNDGSSVPFVSNVASTSSTSSASTILESAPVGGGDQLGYCWNPAFSWADLPTTNGAYP